MNERLETLAVWQEITWQQRRST